VALLAIVHGRFSWKVPGRFMGGSWEVPGRFLEGSWRAALLANVLDVR
jgi:hypothetical protein